jgi:hypothetical protein
MSAVLLAVFDEFAPAEDVRTQLVRDGFPTDRVELTARGERGQAELAPASSARAKFEQYFRTLLSEEDERPFADALAERVDQGSSVTVAVHPRGDIETERAVQLLERAGAAEVIGHDLASQGFEHAAAREEGMWLKHFKPDNPTGADCLYCRLFPGHTH